MIYAVTIHNVFRVFPSGLTTYYTDRVASFLIPPTGIPCEFHCYIGTISLVFLVYLIFSLKKYFSSVFRGEHYVIFAIPFVCTKLFSMLSCSCIMISSDCVFGDWQVFFYCTPGRSSSIVHNRSFFVCLIGLAFFEPRDYRGVFVLKQKRFPKF